MQLDFQKVSGYNNPIISKVSLLGGVTCNIFHVSYVYDVWGVVCVPYEVFCL